jgi:hypothetical protein
VLASSVGWVVGGVDAAVVTGAVRCDALSGELPGARFRNTRSQPTAATSTSPRITLRRLSRGGSSTERSALRRSAAVA